MNSITLTWLALIWWSLCRNQQRPVSLLQGRPANLEHCGSSAADWRWSSSESLPETTSASWLSILCSYLCTAKGPASIHQTRRAYPAASAWAARWHHCRLPLASSLSRGCSSVPACRSSLASTGLCLTPQDPCHRAHALAAQHTVPLDLAWHRRSCSWAFLAASFASWPSGLRSGVWTHRFGALAVAYYSSYCQSQWTDSLFDLSLRSAVCQCFRDLVCSRLIVLLFGYCCSWEFQISRAASSFRMASSVHQLSWDLTV